MTQEAQKVKRKFYIAAFVTLVVGGGAVAACSNQSGGSSASDRAARGNAGLQGQIYQQKNNIEFNNYNDRQRIADDPTTLLWCTAYSSNPNVKPVTVPIVGKLTSSEKRPYATSQVKTGDNYEYSPEIPGPDKMFGSSAPYRYGFTPGHVYIDFTDMPTICTTQPTVYQATQTQILLKVDPGLNAASQQARQALGAGAQPGGAVTPNAGNQAQQILEGATGGR